MTPERWQEVNRVLAGALERAPEARSAYLDQGLHRIGPAPLYRKTRRPGQANRCHRTTSRVAFGVGAGDLVCRFGKRETKSPPRLDNRWGSESSRSSGDVEDSRPHSHFVPQHGHSCVGVLSLPTNHPQVFSRSLHSRQSRVQGTASRRALEIGCRQAWQTPNVPARIRASASSIALRRRPLLA